MDKATWTALTSHVITFAEVLLIYMKLQIDIAITYVCILISAKSSKNLYQSTFEQN